MREEVLAALEEEISGGGGFMRTVYESVAAAAQCEGGADGCECGECVSEAAWIAEEHCPLDTCKYAQGVPTNLYPGKYFSCWFLLICVDTC